MTKRNTMAKQEKKAAPKAAEAPKAPKARNYKEEILKLASDLQAAGVVVPARAAAVAKELIRAAGKLPNA